jgi:5-methyltetrahydrofolate--homocysteine methyltransferase
MGPLELLEGPLLAAMGRVGDAFGKGSRFLPQVVQSARVMKEAFALLAPVMQEGAAARTRQKTVLLATVRGDVHDIGKNIVGVVLACNNFRVVDLGVMVSPEDIVTRAKEEQADLVGISGLITPSLGEMCAVAEAMEAAGLDIPLMVGGATTSDVYTAVKIAPLYRGGVVRVADASLCAGVASKLTGPEAAVFLAETADAQGRLRGARARESHERHFYSLAEARARRFRPEADSFSVPLEPGLRSFPRIPVEELVPLIHWPSYLAAWHLPGRLPDLYEDPDLGPQARFVMDLAEAYLRQGASEGRLQVRGTAGIYDAWSGQDDLNADDIHVETIRLDSESEAVGAAGNPDVPVLPMLRRTEKKPGEETCLCLSDFVAPGRGAGGRLGVFAVSVSDSGEAPGAVLEPAAPEPAAADPVAPEALAAQLVRHRLAEAASQWIQDQIARELPEDNRAFIRPAVGFPCLRDHSLKALLLPLAGGEASTGIRLTDSFMMVPEASVLGLYLFHPEARYFDTGRLSREAFEEYRSRRGLTDEAAAQLLGPFLGE